MKVIENKSQKKWKHYNNSFRIAVNYSVVFEVSIASLPWSDLLRPLGYSQNTEGERLFYTKRAVLIEFQDSTIFFNFDPAQTTHDSRVDEIVLVVSQCESTFQKYPKSLVLNSVNSYILNNYQNTKAYQKKCIDYFFQQMDGEDYAIIVSAANDIFTILDVKFEKGDGNKGVLTFSVTTSLKNSGDRVLDSVERVKNCLEQLRKENYQAWRAVVSDKVLRVMEGGN
ncbi:MAG: hypothetical protein MJZ86_09145 [Bacteroidales bacterium]|nr:hypothetical protein [Bacteroidales bacterium]